MLWAIAQRWYAPHLPIVARRLNQMCPLSAHLVADIVHSAIQYSPLVFHSVELLLSRPDCTEHAHIHTIGQTRQTVVMCLIHTERSSAFTTRARRTETGKTETTRLRKLYL